MNDQGLTVGAKRILVAAIFYLIWGGIGILGSLLTFTGALGFVLGDGSLVVGFASLFGGLFNVVIGIAALQNRFKAENAWFLKILGFLDLAYIAMMIVASILETTTSVADPAIAETAAVFSVCGMILPIIIAIVFIRGASANHTQHKNSELPTSHSSQILGTAFIGATTLFLVLSAIFNFM